MTLNASVDLAISAALGQAADLAEAKSRLTKSYRVAFTTGAGIAQADLLWHDQRSIAPSTSEDLDLAGALAGLLGGTAVFARVKGLIVAAAAGNQNNVIVGANVVNGWAGLIGPTGASGGTVTLKPGAWFAAGTPDAAGWPVTTGTNDLLHVTNGGAVTSVTYDVILIGAAS